MDTISSMGWLVPAWIIGAPLLAGLVMLMTTPKGSNRFTYTGTRDHTSMPAMPAMPAMPGLVGGRDGQVLPR